MILYHDKQALKSYFIILFQNISNVELNGFVWEMTNHQIDTWPPRFTILFCCAQVMIYGDYQQIFHEVRQPPNVETLHRQLKSVSFIRDKQTPHCTLGSQYQLLSHSILHNFRSSTAWQFIAQLKWLIVGFMASLQKFKKHSTSYRLFQQTG